MQFSRYQRLLQLLRSADYGWHNGEDADDRIVIFTERIETKNYLEEHLRQDLKLPKKAIVSMDGGMSDVEQQKIVEDFGTKSSPIRILVASDVASEGLNLHYLSHRLIHFDTPWSLMVFQQRNGRIDRYGQRKQPDIRFMMINSRNAKIQGDTHILEILQQKEDQARKDIGDPSLLMGKFDVDQEEDFTREAIESGESAENFAARLCIPDEDIDHSDERSGDVETVADDDVFDPLSFFNLTTPDGSDTTSTEENESAGESTAGSADDGGIADSSTLMSDYEYVDEGSPARSSGSRLVLNRNVSCVMLMDSRWSSKGIARCARGCADVCRTRRCCKTTSPNGVMTRNTAKTKPTVCWPVSMTSHGAGSNTCGS